MSSHSPEFEAPRKIDLLELHDYVHECYSPVAEDRFSMNSIPNRFMPATLINMAALGPAANEPAVDLDLTEEPVITMNGLDGATANGPAPRQTKTTKFTNG